MSGALNFEGLAYVFFGNFTMLRSEVALWRIRTLSEIIKGRQSTFGARRDLGLLTAKQAMLAETLFDNLRTFVVVTSDRQRDAMAEELAANPLPNTPGIVSLADVDRALEHVGRTTT